MFASDKLTYSVSELARATGLGRSYLYLQLQAKVLPSIRAGKRRLIRREDAVAWLASLPEV
jgi:excisionase family DNA binding protein